MGKIEADIKEHVFVNMVCQVCGWTTGGAPPKIKRVDSYNNLPELEVRYLSERTLPEIHLGRGDPVCGHCKNKGSLIILKEGEDDTTA